jgi:hypothetical protein
MIDNKNNYYDEDRNKLEKANMRDELKSIEKGILEESDELTSTIIMRHQITQ